MEEICSSLMEEEFQSSVMEENFSLSKAKIFKSSKHKNVHSSMKKKFGSLKNEI
jgi:hypothetical protein